MALSILDPDDEVILPIPYYFNHEMAIVMANATPVLVSTDNNYQLDIDIIKKLSHQKPGQLLQYRQIIPLAQSIPKAYSQK